MTDTFEILKIDILIDCNGLTTDRTSDLKATDRTSADYRSDVRLDLTTDRTSDFKSDESTDRTQHIYDELLAFRG